MDIKKAPTYITSDGARFNEHGSAVAHEKFLKRMEQLRSCSLNTDLFGVEDDGRKTLEESDLSEFLARNADALIDMLTVKSNRGRKPRQPAAAAAAAG